MKFDVELLEKTYEVDAVSWQQAKLRAAGLYKDEVRSELPVVLLASLARARKRDGGRSPRIVSLRELS